MILFCVVLKVLLLNSQLNMVNCKNISNTFFHSEMDQSLKDVMSMVIKPSAMSCIVSCRETTGCSSVSYSRQQRECRLHSEHPEDSDVDVDDAATGFRLYYENLVTECGHGWSVFGNSLYCTNFNTLGWYDAKSYCESDGAHLLKIEDSEENEITTRMAKSRWRYTWIGARYMTEYSDFRWTDNTPVTYDGWHPGEPDGSGCVDFSIYQDFEWNDHHDCYEALESICEKVKT